MASRRQSQSLAGSWTTTELALEQLQFETTSRRLQINPDTDTVDEWSISREPHTHQRLSTTLKPEDRWANYRTKLQ